MSKSTGRLAGIQTEPQPRSSGMRGRWNRKEYMKVTKEYEVADAAKNPQTGEVLFALKATGNCCIYTDDGELLESTDEAHLQANIQAQKEAELKEHYKKLHDYYEAEYGI